MKTLVTGASGFLGGALARALAEQGNDVRVFQRSPCLRLAALGIEVHQGDLRDLDTVRRAVSGVDVVFHNAAKVGVWGRYEDFAAVNVQGTENILNACRAEGVGRLVFTSSASVVFDGADLEGVDESAPYPRTWLSPYPQTKAEAERRVLAAAGDDLLAVSLRPHLVWGPADPHLIGRILLAARQDRVGVIGDGRNKIDTTHIDNAVHAHLLADQQLRSGALCNGKAYFITDGDPQPIRDLFNRILAAADLPAVSRSLSVRSAERIAGVLEWLYRTFRIAGEPAITRFVVREFSTSHWFDIQAARRDLGYTPRVTMTEGFQRLHESFFPDGTSPRPGHPEPAPPFDVHRPQRRHQA